MAQYSILSSSGEDTIELTDGVSTYRVQVRDDDLCFDGALTDVGFLGKEDIDWINISISTLATGQSEFRIGARTQWVIDQAMTATGFSGIQNIDWGNIEEHSLT